MEHSERDTQYASRIVERLLSRDGERLDLELENNLVISDLESDTNSFTTELYIANDFGFGIPAVKIGGDDGFLTPISLFSILGFPFMSDIRNFGGNFPNRIRDRRWWRRNPYIYEWYETFRYLGQIDYDNQWAGMRSISPDEARGAFTERAVEFLATRITSVRNFNEGETREREKWGRTASLNLTQNFGGRKVTTPGCYFSVSTNSNGLRVFWSGAYYVAPNYFSHPTSPATSVLQAGTYIFGIDGGAYGNTIQWDTNAVTSLPGNPFVHLNY